MKALVLPLVAAATLLAQDPDEGTSSSVKPRIPEPIVFDLIRPLGVERGELEANSPVRSRPHRPLQGAPEIEYAFAKGYGLELELPLENRHIDTYKAALQGTLPGPWKKKFIHGWQGAGEVTRNRQHWHTDAFYLAGVRFHSKWSTFSMTGWRAERGPLCRNDTLLRSQCRKTTPGRETNYQSPGAAGSSPRQPPQRPTRPPPLPRILTLMKQSSPCPSPASSSPTTPPAPSSAPPSSPP